ARTSRPRYRQNPQTMRITAINHEPMGCHALVRVGTMMKTMPTRIAMMPTIFTPLLPLIMRCIGRHPGHDRPAPVIPLRYFSSNTRLAKPMGVFGAEGTCDDSPAQQHRRT